MLARIGLGGHLGIAFALVAAIVGATICEEASRTVSESIRGHVLGDLGKLSSDINHDIELSLGLSLDRIRISAENLGRSGLALDGSDAAAWTDALQSSFTDVTWVALLDAQGRVAATSDFGPREGSLFQGDAGKDSQQRTVVEEGGVPARYLLSQPLRDDHGKLVGRLLAEFGDSWMAKVVSSVLLAHGLEDGQQVLVGDASGKLLARSSAKGLDAGSGVFLAGADHFAGERAWPDGFQSLSVVLPPTRSSIAPALHWQVAVRENLEQADAPAAALRHRIYLIGALLILGGALLGGGASLRLSLPLRRLARAAEQISEGQLGMGIPRQEEFREVALLSESLRDMVGTLRSNEARLSLLNETLAQHINDRDADFKAAHAGLVANEAKLRAVIETAIDGVMIVNGQGIIETFNLSCEKIFGWGRAEILGKTILTVMPQEWQLLHGQMFSGAREIDEQKVAGHARVVRGLRKGGEQFPLEISLSSTQVGGDQLYIAMVRDISERVVAEERLFAMATQDGLTGVRNRRYFLGGLESEVARCRRHGRQLSLLALDADHFKAVNDTFGHAAGDLVLKRLAETCRDNLREVDFVGRMGGEEFAIVMPDTDLQTAGLAAERLRRLVAEQRIDFEGETLQITMSVGIAGLRRDAPEAGSEDLLRRADQALYSAKAGGRNRVVLAPAIN